MTEKHFNDVTLLSIERKEAESLSFDHTIDRFAAVDKNKIITSR